MRRCFLFLSIVLTLGGGRLVAATPPEPIQQGHPALGAIWDAYQKGEITDSQVYLYRLYLLLDPQKLPDRFRLAGVGTPRS